VGVPDFQPAHPQSANLVTKLRGQFLDTMPALASRCTELIRGVPGTMPALPSQGPCFDMRMPL